MDSDQGKPAAACRLCQRTTCRRGTAHFDDGARAAQDRADCDAYAASYWQERARLAEALGKPSTVGAVLELVFEFQDHNGTWLQINRGLLREWSDDITAPLGGRWSQWSSSLFVERCTYYTERRVRVLSFNGCHGSPVERGPVPA